MIGKKFEPLETAEDIRAWLNAALTWLAREHVRAPSRSGLDRLAGLWPVANGFPPANTVSTLEDPFGCGLIRKLDGFPAVVSIDESLAFTNVWHSLNLEAIREAFDPQLRSTFDSVLRPVTLDSSSDDEADEDARVEVLDALLRAIAAGRIVEPWRVIAA